MNKFEDLIAQFKDWLKAKKYQNETISSHASNVNYVNSFYNVLDEYAKDNCESLLDGLTFSKHEVSPKTLIEIDGDYCTGLATYKQAIKLFVSFLKWKKCILVAAPFKKAMFYGNFNDFKKFKSPVCVNLVNGICEYCGRQTKIQFAYVKFNSLLPEEMQEQGEDCYEIETYDFSEKFKNDHFPLKDRIFFLCPNCHNAVEKAKQLQHMLSFL